MTIADLVRYLQTLPQDAPVLTPGPNRRLVPPDAMDGIGGMMMIERGIYGPHKQAAAFTGEWRHRGAVVRNAENLERIEYASGFVMRLVSP